MLGYTRPFVWCLCSIAPTICLASGRLDWQRDLLSRSAAQPLSVTSQLDKAFVGKGCSFCIQGNFDFRANFDRLAQAISGVASDIHDVEKTLDTMAQNITREMQRIADAIKDLARSVAMLGADILLHIVAMRGFLNAVKAEVDLGILVTELQTSIARISHRQSLLQPLMHNKDALTPDQKQQLAAAILDINEGSDIDSTIIHDELTGSGGVVPRVQPALDVYIKQGYRLDQLAKVYGALFIYQIQAYAQLYWAYMNTRPVIQLNDYNTTAGLQMSRLAQQWQNFGSRFLWGCYWDDGFRCPDWQECHSEMRGLQGFACNYASAPVTFDIVTGGTSFTFGSASTNTQLSVVRDALTGTCSLGVRDCSGGVPKPVPVVVNASTGNSSTNVTCSPGAAAVLNEKGVFSFAGAGTIVNVSTMRHRKYALHITESGQLAIIGDDSAVLWQWPPTPLPSPPGGPCPTTFSNRTLQPVSYNKCQCITTARWRRVGDSNANMTSSLCGRLCQAFGSQYTASAPRATGECWCATPEATQEQELVEQPNDCNATCTICPGDPTSACGVSNSVAIYTCPSEAAVSQIEVLI